MTRFLVSESSWHSHRTLISRQLYLCNADWVHLSTLPNMLMQHRSDTWCLMRSTWQHHIQTLQSPSSKAHIPWRWPWTRSWWSVTVGGAREAPARRPPARPMTNPPGGGARGRGRGAGTAGRSISPPERRRRSRRPAIAGGIGKRGWRRAASASRRPWVGTGEWEEEGGGEDWSGQWASADGMTTGLTKRERGGRWRLGNGRRQRKGESLETATGRRRTEEAKTTRAAGRAGEVETEVGWGRDVSQNCLLSLFLCFFGFRNLF